MVRRVPGEFTAFDARKFGSDQRYGHPSIASCITLGLTILRARKENIAVFNGFRWRTFGFRTPYGAPKAGPKRTRTARRPLSSAAANVILAAVDEGRRGYPQISLLRARAPRSAREPASRAHSPHSRGRCIGCRARLGGVIGPKRDV